MKYRVGDRLNIGGEICTVRYVGEICKWPETNAYGVEWDNPTRGKNDGAVDGVRYFEVSKYRSGSFVKATKLENEAHTGFSFDRAFAQKYLTPPIELASSAPASKPEVAKGLRPTEKVFLDGCSINDERISESALNVIRANCAEVTQLDLSSNLLSTFSQTCQLISEFKNLRYLDLSRNVFSKGWDSLGEFSFHRVKRLQLVGCGLKIDQLEKVFKCFPCLETLDLSWNDLSSPTGETIYFPSTLTELSLSGNLMNSLPSGISSLRLRSLNLSHNLLHALDILPFPKLIDLDISHNMIQKWDTLDLLNQALPELRFARINGNLFNAAGDEISNFYATIARLQSIEGLDGSMLSKATRQEAELFFVSKVISGQIEYDRRLPRWTALARKYSIHEKQQVTRKSWLEYLIITVRVVNEENQNSAKCSILTNYSVRYLKTIIARKLQLGKGPFQLFFYPAPDARQNMDSEFRQVNYYGICDNTTIYIKRVA
ncbi:hypothetical protein HG536_0F03250 [Torulaspora globosa]|uniref:CAP-Gly domain-containing protein n=1 Tax=Torulaspora globosa TaxID=48254 RepID=A0A7G3ZKG4_9SACH|nr:uncharacterized protein HG536_0F03250 [Torulaspora globosa]QLL34000.1 hypothetical protein HG536_0F03250 [Torulaspora globosa]